ncbi:MAG: methyltransferase domain-containing protein [Deltaproteobacteria bacterium]
MNVAKNTLRPGRRSTPLSASDRRVGPPDDVPWSRRVMASLLPWGPLAADAEGVELGAGVGAWATAVAPNVGRLHVFTDPANIDVARRVLAAHEHVEISDAEHIDLPDASQAFGYALGGLDDPEAQLAELARVLAPGAPLAVYFPAPKDAPWPAAPRLLRRFLRPSPHTGRDDVVALLERSGFTDVRFLPVPPDWRVIAKRRRQPGRGTLL